ncbi:MAG: 1,4-dihydroxy-2-naphthoate octaprenyltransferase [Prevotella sp.]
MIKPVLLWLRIIRPQTLFASLVPVLISVLVVSRCGIPVDGVTACVTASCALALQILSNLINDYYDFLRGTDKAGRAGYKRALAEGEVSERAMRSACILAALMSCLLGFWLVLAGGWVILVIGLSALLFAWLYTATRFSLSYLGIADIFVFLYYGVVASCGTAYLLLAAISYAADPFPILRGAFFAGSVCGLISMCVLSINNLRDIASDREVGKKTLPVRFGKRAAESLMLLYVLLMPLFSYMAFGVSCSMLIVVPALFMWLKTMRAHGVEYNKCLLMAGLCNAVYLLLSVL